MKWNEMKFIQFTIIIRCKDNVEFHYKNLLIENYYIFYVRDQYVRRVLSKQISDNL